MAIELTGFYPKQYNTEMHRLVRYWDVEQKHEFVFLTNATHISALQVAELYKNRWQVKLFFKWLKQYLKIKKFKASPLISAFHFEILPLNPYFYFLK